jgi:hypothetical protein
MAQIKGKFIAFTVQLMSIYKDAQKDAEEALFKLSGKHSNELEPETFYDTKLWDIALKAYADSSPTGKTAIVTMGRNVYPLINKTVGIPPEKIKTPFDAIMFETENFLVDHKSDSVSKVIPRKVLLSEDRHIIIEAPAPGYDPILYKGVFLGILDMLGIKTGKVEMTDTEKAIFDISW